MTVIKWWSVLVTLACYSIRRSVTGLSIRLDQQRPVPSNDPGAVPDLIEIPTPALDPRPADLNVTVLLAKLGAKFDKTYMSVVTPEHMVPGNDIPFRSVTRPSLSTSAASARVIFSAFVFALNGAQKSITYPHTNTHTRARTVFRARKTNSFTDFRLLPAIIG